MLLLTTLCAIFAVASAAPASPAPVASTSSSQVSGGYVLLVSNVRLNPKSVGRFPIESLTVRVGNVQALCWTEPLRLNHNIGGSCSKSDFDMRVTGSGSKWKFKLRYKVAMGEMEYEIPPNDDNLVRLISEFLAGKIWRCKCLDAFFG